MFQSVISAIPMIYRIIFTVLIFVIFDLYAYQAIRKLTAGSRKWVRRPLRIAYWFLSITLYLSALMGFAGFFAHAPEALILILTALFFASFLAKMLMLIPLLMEDIYRLISWIISFFARIFKSKRSDGEVSAHGLMDRKTFISRLSIALGGITFTGMGYGVLKGAHHYKVHRLSIQLKNLPESFKGLRIAQISDIHSGSFWDREAVKKGVNMLMAEKADIIFFTGDLVNNTADEMDESLKEIFGGLNAPMGVFSILGNHDYGDYHRWPDNQKQNMGNNMQADKSHMSPLQLENLDKLKDIHREMGWDLLLNEHRVLTRGTDQIALIGVENYGARRRFARYGRLDKAYEGVENFPVKLLLSHDPSHWETQVLEEFRDIDLMFAGHTHGFQFGIETAGFRWSPASLVYKQWAGLYNKGEQYLYVNRGYGYLGYPGRLGIRPEITVITLS